MPGKHSSRKTLFFFAPLITIFLFAGGCGSPERGRSVEAPGSAGVISDVRPPKRRRRNTSQTYKRWLAFYGGEDAEEFENVVQDSRGDLVSVGGADAYSGDDEGDAIAIKLDEYGNVLWAKTYGGNEDDALIDIAVAPEGGYIAAGWTKSFGAEGTDVWVVKIDEEGEIEWERRYGGDGDEQATTIDADDRGFVVGAGTTSFGAGQTDIWILCLSRDGKILWQNAYGGPKDESPPSDYGEFAVGAFFDKKGNIVAGATSLSYEENGDILVLKLEPEGGLPIWQRLYGTEEAEGIWTIAGLENGDYLIPGIREDPKRDYEEVEWIARVREKDGTIVWQKEIGIAGASSEPLNASATRDGGILLAGYFERGEEDWYSSGIRMDAEGGIRWAFQEKKGRLDYLDDLVELRDGSLVGVGIYNSPDKDNQLMSFRFSARGGDGCGIIRDLDYEEAPGPLKWRSVSVMRTPTKVIAKKTAATTRDIARFMAPDYECGSPEAKAEAKGFFSHDRDFLVRRAPGDARKAVGFPLGPVLSHNIEKGPSGHAGEEAYDGS